MNKAILKTIILGMILATPTLAQQNAELKDAALNPLRAGISTASQEGLPNPSTRLDISDLKETAYTTVELIQRSLQEANTLATGQKISHFANSTKEIVKISGLNAYEEATRITLNRANDVVDSTLKIFGSNSDLIANTIAGFYTKSLHVAAGYANNPSLIIDLRNPTAPLNSKVTSRAQFGIYYANFLWSQQSTLISQSAKSVILIKLLDYLFDDLNLDTQRREPIIKQTIIDIDNLQKNNSSYKKILLALSQNEEPATSDANQLRGKTETILTNINGRRGDIRYS